MALGFSAPAGEGDFVDIIKYDVKAGRLIRVDKNGETKDEVDITSNFMAVFDFPNIEVGWAIFEPGTAPQWHLNKLSKGFPAKPEGDKWRQAFRMRVKLHSSCGGDVRELSATSMTLRQSMDILHDQFEERGPENADKLPVIKLEGTTRQKTNYGTNYIPRFVIAGWADRPADLGNGLNARIEEAVHDDVPFDAPPATGSTPMTAAADFGDFG